MSTDLDITPAVAESAQSSCCGSAPQPEPAASSGCGGAPVVRTVVIPNSVVASPSTGCCGETAGRADAELRVGVGLEDAVRDGLDERLHAADTWPYALPTWLGATERSLDGARAWHSVARSGDEAVFIPGFVFDEPGLVDVDPRTYLGWEAPSGEAACCGVKSCCGTQDQVDALGDDLLFPALVLGSPLGYRSDIIALGDQAPQLTADLVDRLVPAALAAGIRGIVAPWVSDRPVNGPLLAALHANGANVSFWGEENFFKIEHDSYEAYTASLNARKRRRIREDDDKAAATGARVERVTGEDLRPMIGRIAEITLLNRQKYDGGEGADHITAQLTALIDEKADVRAHLAYKGEVLVGSGVTIRQGRRLVVKWAGFDYEAIGDRSGLYFNLIFNLPLRDAFAEGLDSLEIGPGADKVKRLRGCQPRTVYTALLVADESRRDAVAELQGIYGGARRAALAEEIGETEETSTAARLLGRLRSKKEEASSGGCCG